MNASQISELINLDIHAIFPLHGGNINDVYQLQTEQGALCLKVNQSQNGTAILEAEAIGLKHLKQHKIACPTVIDLGLKNNISYLLMDFYPSQNPAPDFWKNMGQQLASLHLMTSNSFGFDSDNYIGLLPQSNKRHTSWASFYFQERLLPQLKQLSSRTELPNNWESTCQGIASLFPDEKPALLHGDLWSGNYLCLGDQALFIDPAIYYGHREMDLGMMLLFGGFSPQLFEEYDAILPLEKDWKSRVQASQLYPLLVHANMFRGSYITQVLSILKHYQ